MHFKVLYLLSISHERSPNQFTLAAVSWLKKKTLPMLQQNQSLKQAAVLSDMSQCLTVFYSSVCNSASSYSANDPGKMTHSDTHSHTNWEWGLINEAINNSADNRIKPLASLGARMNYLKGHLKGADIYHSTLTKCNATKMNACVQPSLSEGQKDPRHAYT